MKKAMSLLLALGMFAAMLTPCAVAEEAAPASAEAAQASALTELAEDTALEISPETTEEAPAEEAPVAEEKSAVAPEAESAASEAAPEEPAEEVAAETNAAGDVAINETNFPDSVFRDYVKAFDLNHDDVLTPPELSVVTKINLDSLRASGKMVSNLKGIETFLP